MKDLIGDRNMSEALFDELLVVAYEYNSQQPRFYSKFFSEKDKAVYDVKMSKATGGSSAAPVYFEPQQLQDMYGLEQLVIDGGIIGNNPALFSYMMQSKIQKKAPIRIVSIGTGVAEVNKVDADSITRFNWLTMAGDFMIDIDVFAADKTLNATLAKQLEKQNADNGVEKANYLRMQTISSLGMDKVD